MSSTAPRRRPNDADPGTSIRIARAELSISAAQRRVLLALARPVLAEVSSRRPATNRHIAEELFLSIDAVKTHLRALTVKFGIADLPQNRKRVRSSSLRCTTARSPSAISHAA